MAGVFETVRGCSVAVMGLPADLKDGTELGPEHVGGALISLRVGYTDHSLGIERGEETTYFQFAQIALTPGEVQQLITALTEGG